MSEADAVFIPIYADIGCRLSQEKAADKAAWRAATDAFWATFPHRFPDVKSKPHFGVTGRCSAGFSKMGVGEGDGFEHSLVAVLAWRGNMNCHN